jgi:hypothetical protein
VTAAIRAIVDAVIGLAQVEPQEIGRVLGLTLQPRNPSPPMEYFEAVLRSGPFESVDFRLNRETGLAFLVLTPAEGTKITEASIDLTPYGAVVDIDINPQIPPEGTQAFAQDAGALRMRTRIHWQFTMESRLLRLVSFEWRPHLGTEG